MKTKLSVFCDKVIEAGWLAAVIAVPMFFNIYTARTFEPDKITLLRSIVGIMVLAWLISVIEVGSRSDDTTQTLTERVQKMLKIPLFLPTMLLALVYIISTIFSISPQVSLWGSYQRLQGAYSMLSYIVLFALIAGNLRTRDQIDRLVSTLIITSIPVSLYGIIQHYGLDPLPWAGDVTARVASTMGNAIFVASYLIMIVPITLNRLIKAMTAIIKEDKASWGYTILAAVYIFTLAVQLVTIIFSRSRGPMLGLLASFFVMGLLIILLLRRLDSDSSALSLQEIGTGFFAIPLGLIFIFGGAGYLLGLGASGLVSFDKMPFVGVAVAVLIGAVGLLYMVIIGKGWRWLWLSWLGLGVMSIVFIIFLNIRGTALDVYLDPVRSLPYMDRLSSVITTGGTGKVRMLIWDASMVLIAPHKPLGIPDDEMVGADSSFVNAIRPLVGYGPESMFNAFAFVYPPDLAHAEARGSSADRSHNETMDSLVITGIFGFLAFYFMMVSLFYYSLKWLGWVTDKSDSIKLIAILTLSGIGGAMIPLMLDGDGTPFTFVPVALPFSLIAGVVIYVTWQGIASQKKDENNQISARPLLLIGLLGAIVGHFIEVHFVFSIAATYTYFWASVGLIFALSRVEKLETLVDSNQQVDEKIGQPDFLKENKDKDNKKEDKTGRSKRSRSRRRKELASSSVTVNSRLRRNNIKVDKGESLDAWMGGYGLVMAIIFIIMTFNFVTPQFKFDIADNNSLSLLWMFTITWFIGLAIAMSEAAVRAKEWKNGINWMRAFFLYTVTSLFYFFVYIAAHRLQFSPIVRQDAANPITIVGAARFLTNGLILFYLFLLFLIIIFAVMLSWGQGRKNLFWRAENWWLYPPLIIAVVAIIGFKNINVVRADVFLKEGDRYRNEGRLNEAIILHKEAISMDSDEDFYYLMLALDYQLKAQNGNFTPNEREDAWNQGEQTALEARRINPFNPDNTGNMGRYYFTIGQIRDSKRYDDALLFFERATTLAPSNVVYHNLWAQTYYILQNYNAAIDRLQTSVAIDDKWPPTWLLLGDAYAAAGNIDKALESHSQSIRLGNDFFDQFFDQRLNFYLSAGTGKMEELLAVAQESVQKKEDDYKRQWSVGHIYNLMGQQEQAIPYFEQAIILGAPDNIKRELAVTHLTLAQKLYDDQQDYQATIDKIQVAQSIDNSYAPSWLLLGDSYIALKNADEALKAHSQAIRLGNEFFDQSLEPRLRFYIDADRLENIINIIKQAKPDDPTALLAIGQAYNLSGQPELALPYLDQANNTDGNSSSDPRKLANSYLNMQQYEQAMPIYESLLTQNPNDIEAISALAFIYAQIGRLDEAIAMNQAVLQQLPEDYDTWKNLSLLYQQTSQLNEALDAARQAQTLAPEADLPGWKPLIANIENQLAAGK